MKLHRARKSEEEITFGDCDSEWFGDVATRAMKGLTASADPDDPPMLSASYEAMLSVGEPDVVAWSLLCWETGIRENLRLDGTPRLRTERDPSSRRVVAVAEFPSDRSAGLLAIFVPYRGRNVRSFVESKLKQAAAGLGMTLDVAPVVPRAALEKALEKGMMRLSLTRYGAPSDESAEGMVATDDTVLGMQTLEYKAERGSVLRPGRELKRIIAGPPRSGEVIVIGDVEYTDGSVTVELDDGYERTFSIWPDPDERGYPMKVFIESTRALPRDDDGYQGDDIAALIIKQALPAGRANRKV